MATTFNIENLHFGTQNLAHAQPSTNQVPLITSSQTKLAVLYKVDLIGTEYEEN